MQFNRFLRYSFLMFIFNAYDHGNATAPSAAKPGSVASLETTHSKKVTAPDSVVQAIEQGDEKTVTEYLKSGHIEAGNCAGHTLLILAIRHQKLNLVQELLKRGANIEACSSAGETPLSFAACGANPAILKEVLKAKPDLKKRYYHIKRTVLSLAVFKFLNCDIPLENVRLLVEAGADIYATDGDGKDVAHDTERFIKDEKDAVKVKRAHELKAYLESLYKQREENNIIAARQADEKQGKENHFEIFKRHITSSPLRVKDWNQIAKLSAEDLYKSTNCHNSACHVIALLAGINLTHLLGRIQELIRGAPTKPALFNDSVKLLENEYFGTFENFFKKNKDGFENDIAKKILNTSEQVECLIFQIAPHPWAHSYVVEKMSDGKETRWRVYQSWFRRFTLAQWLGIDPWPSSQTNDFQKNLTKMHAEYGNGKVLKTSEQICKCIKDHKFRFSPPFDCKDANSYPLFVRFFKGKPLVNS